MKERAMDNHTNQPNDLSVLDVKELYDLAYAEKERAPAKFKQLLNDAIKMDLIYRRQLASKVYSYSPYQGQQPNQNKDKSQVA